MCYTCQSAHATPWMASGTRWSSMLDDAVGLASRLRLRLQGTEATGEHTERFSCQRASGAGLAQRPSKSAAPSSSAATWGEQHPDQDPAALLAQVRGPADPWFLHLSGHRPAVLSTGLRINLTHSLQSVIQQWPLVVRAPSHPPCYRGLPQKLVVAQGSLSRSARHQPASTRPQ
jgi:hypothetical protein